VKTASATAPTHLLVLDPTRDRAHTIDAATNANPCYIAICPPLINRSMPADPDPKDGE